MNDIIREIRLNSRELVTIQIDELIRFIYLSVKQSLQPAFLACNVL